jgi:hypothetical protein
MAPYEAKIGGVIWPKIDRSPLLEMSASMRLRILFLKILFGLDLGYKNDPLGMFFTSITIPAHNVMVLSITSAATPVFVLWRCNIPPVLSVVALWRRNAPRITPRVTARGLIAAAFGQGRVPGETAAGQSPVSLPPAGAKQVWL